MEDLLMDDPTKPLPALPAMYVVFSDNGEHIRWWSRSAPSWGEEAGFAAAGATVHALYSVSGRSPAEVPPNWPDDVQEAQKDYAAKLDRMIVCCEVLEEVEETEGLDAETIQNARDNALFATAEHQRTLDALCAAVWRSAQQ
jgi:hypothetical protein